MGVSSGLLALWSCPLWKCQQSVLVGHHFAQSGQNCIFRLISKMAAMIKAAVHWVQSPGSALHRRKPAWSS
jgi:hypothetical protein